MNRSVLVPAAAEIGCASLYGDEHRATAKILGEMLLSPPDAQLFDVARTGPRMGEIGLFKHLIPGRQGRAVDVRTLCTVREQDRFFSHRRDGPRTGRHALVAMWKPSAP